MSIKGFEIETAPLSEYEMTVLLPCLVRGLRTKVGKGTAVKNAHICSRLKALGYEINEARVRKVINYIRINGLVPRLIATSAGYYVATTREEGRDYIESLIGRENAIRQVRVAMENQFYGA